MSRLPELARWLIDKRTLGLAATRGLRFERKLAETLIAPRLRMKQALRRRRRHARAMDMLTQAHLARHAWSTPSARLRG